MATFPCRHATSPTGLSRTGSPTAFRRRAVVAGLGLLIGVIGLAGCSAGDSSSGGAPAQGDMPGVVDAGGRGGVEPGAEPGADAGAPEPLQERALIYTGTVRVEVASVAAAADEAIAVVDGLGGFVAQDNRTLTEDESQATLVFRVPTDQFSSTLDRLARLGTEQSRDVQVQDVTDKLVDLDARIATQQASVDRVRELLARAETIADIVSLETELTRRQAELDSLTQRRATMAGLVDLATITLVLHEPERSVDEDVETGFLPGLRSGWQALLVSLEVLLTLAGWLLPWAVVFGLPTLAIVLAVRRHRGRRPPVAVAPPPVAAPPVAPFPVAGPPSGTPVAGPSEPPTANPPTGAGPAANPPGGGATQG